MNRPLFSISKTITISKQLTTKPSQPPPHTLIATKHLQHYHYHHSSTKMVATKQVLVVGLAKPPTVGPEAVRAAAGSEENLKRMIQATMKKATEAGYEIDVNQTLPESFDETIANIREKLQKKSFDAYIIGFGIRGVPEFTDAFERLVNVGREVAPQTRLGFNTRPDDLVETLDRILA